MEQHFRQLVNKYLINSLTAAEQEELAALSRLPENHAVLEEMIETDLRQKTFVDGEHRQLKQQLFEQLEARIAAADNAQVPGVTGPHKIPAQTGSNPGSIQTPPEAGITALNANKAGVPPQAGLTDADTVQMYPRRRPWKQWAAAAILIAILGSGAWLLQQNAQQRQMARKPVEDVAPGSNKATLTLADGTTIELDDSREGDLTTQGGVKVVKLDSGMLAYQGTGKPVINTIATPRGGQYQVVLPDGTRVWLNSASSLQFPTAFTGGERLVTLTGEGYFEVTKDPAKPFRVKAGETTVQVLGTSFNIMSYDNEPQQNTTLLEGAVKLNASGLAQILHPGEQAVVTYQSGRVKVQPADLEEAVAWKNGKFRFVRRNISGIMRQIERWYNVEVELKGDLSQVVLSGVMSRREYVSQLLEALEETGDVHFVVNGKQITVYPGGK